MALRMEDAILAWDKGGHSGEGRLADAGLLCVRERHTHIHNPVPLSLPPSLPPSPPPLSLTRELDVPPCVARSVPDFTSQEQEQVEEEQAQEQAQVPQGLALEAARQM